MSEIETPIASPPKPTFAAVFKKAWPFVSASFVIGGILGIILSLQEASPWGFDPTTRAIIFATADGFCCAAGALPFAMLGARIFWPKN